MPASPLEKFPSYGGENSKIMDLAVAISNNFSRADPQISELGVSCRPTADSGWNNFYGREQQIAVIHIASTRLDRKPSTLR